MGQLLTESLILALISAAAAIAVSRLVLVGTTSALMRTMPPEIAEMVRLSAPSLDVRVLVFLFVAALAATALFGLVPALHASRPNLLRAIWAEPARDRRPNRARNTLIVVQVTASALLLICAGIFLRGALQAGRRDPGLRVADTIIIEFDERERPALLQAIAAEPAVAAVFSASWPGSATMERARGALVAPGDGASRVRVTYRFVTPSYFDAPGIQRLRGRVFAEDEGRSGAPVGRRK